MNYLLELKKQDHLNQLHMTMKSKIISQTEKYTPLIFASGLTLIGLSVGEPNAILALAGAIGTNLLSHSIQNLFPKWQQSSPSLKKFLKQNPIHYALVRSFQNNLDQLELDWKNHDSFKRLNVNDKEMADLTLIQINQFKKVGSKLATNNDLRDDFLDNSNSFPSLQNKLIDRLEKSLYGLNDKYQEFMLQNFIGSWQTQFILFLTTDEGSNARRLIQSHWLSILNATTLKISDDQTQIKNALGDLHKSLEELFASNFQDTRAIFNLIFEEVKSSRKQLSDIQKNIDEVHQLVKPPKYIDYQKESANIIEGLNQYFVGRKTLLSRIKMFSASVNPGYMLIEAERGFGKSAIVSRLIYEYKTGNWEGKKPHIIYQLIRWNKDSRLPDKLLRSINRQLGQLLNSSHLLGRGNLPDLHDEYRSLWERACRIATKEHPILLIIDGLDELQMDQHSAFKLTDFIPQHLSPYTNVLISTRPNQEFNRQVRQHSETENYSFLELDLPEFTYSNIEDLLSIMGFPQNTSSEITHKIHEITLGDPMYTAYLCKHLIQDPSLISNYQSRSFTDAMSFIQDEVFRLNKRISDSNEAEHDVIALLAFAKGKLSVKDIAEILKLKRHQVQKVYSLIQPFIIGTDHWEIDRKEFKEEIQAQLYFEQDENRVNDLLLEWCFSYWTKDFPQDTPEYIKDNFIEHLKISNKIPEIFKLVEDKSWFELKRYDAAWRTTLGNDLIIASQVSFKIFEKDNSIQDWIRSINYQLLRSALENETLSLNEIKFMARLGYIDEAFEQAKLSKFWPYVALDQVASIVIFEKEDFEKGLELYDQMTKLNDYYQGQNSAFEKCDLRLSTARKVLREFPIVYHGKALEWLKEAELIEREILPSSYEEYLVHTKIPTIALKDGIAEAETFLAEISDLSKIRAYRNILSHLPETDSDYKIIIDKIFSLLNNIKPKNNDSNFSEELRTYPKNIFDNSSPTFHDVGLGKI